MRGREPGHGRAVVGTIRAVVDGLKLGQVFLVLALVLGTIDCQDGYPIPPTLCDEWCDQTQRISCFPEDPAACVASCERSGLTRGACAKLTEKAVECLRENPGQKPDCETYYNSVGPCSTEGQAALQCTSTTYPSGSDTE